MRSVCLFLAIAAAAAYIQLDVDLSAGHVNLPRAGHVSLQTDTLTYKQCLACPHERFLARHLCEDCRTLEDAANFCKFGLSPTSRNTVFFGHPRYEVKTYKSDRCGNIDGVKTAICRLTTEKDVTGLSKFECTFLGECCYAEHSTSSGHLFFHEIFCD